MNDSRRDPDSSSRSFSSAWGVALATALLAGVIGIGALLSDAPGDRPAGMLLCVLLALAGVALFWIRRSTEVLTKAFVAIAIGQVLVAATMISRNWGVLSVIGVINGLLLSGWLLAAALFHAGRRES